MSDQFDYDLLVIGAGPGGYVAAIRAAQLKMKVAVIEKDKVGGVCLNIGCIPSKALIHQAELFRAIPDLKKMGAQVDLTNFDYKTVYDKSRKAAELLSRGVQYLLKKNKIDLITGEAKISGANEITLADGKIMSAKNILIATGSRPKELPGFPFDEEMVLSSTGALMLQKLPKKMLILGAGAIGVEFAHIMNAFGVEVHLVEALDNVLPLEDAEAVEVLARAFKKRRVKTYTSTRALSMTKDSSTVTVKLEGKDGEFELTADQILIVVGRDINTDNIGLDSVGIGTEKGFVPVGDFYQTSVPTIYAIGDVVNSPLLAHVASKEGEIAVEHMAGEQPESKLNMALVPSGVYCEPQIASFGITEAKAKQDGISYKKAVFPYRGAGKSVAVEKSEGLVKVIYSPDSKELLGAHIVGAEATELIHELLLAKSSELLPQDIATMIHAHPTLSETLMETMRLIDGWAIHV